MKCQIKAKIFLFICYCLLSLLLGVLPVFMINVRGAVIDSALILGSGRFERNLILFVAISFMGFVGSAVCGRLLEHVNQATSADIDISIIKKTKKLAYPVLDSPEFHSRFDKAKNASELVSSITSAIGRCLTDLATIVFTLLTLAFISAASAIVLTIALSLYAFLVYYQGSKTENFWPRYRERMKRANYLSSLLTRGEFAHERKIFAYDEYIEKECQEELERAEKDNCKIGAHRLCMELMMTIAAALYTSIVVLMLLSPLKNNMITLGSFISLFYALQTLSKVSGDFCLNLFTIYTNSTWSKAYKDFMNLDEESGNKEITDIKTIEFRNVSFSYPGSDRLILKDVSFKISPGGHYALVGENGSGKSTIVKLLLGLYKPSGGQVCVDGINISDLTLDKRRQLICSVFQSVAHYPFSIRENVSLSQEEVLDDGKLLAIFEKLGCSTSFHDYDQPLTQSNDQGAGLSGGEWQKLAISRALVSSAPFVIMDEPNAALDPISEMEMYKSYVKILAERTSLLITHRLGAVKDVDTILVLKDGGIVAEGRHSFLMDSCSYYKALYDTQRDFYVTK